jgi:hypothetical protein
MGVNTGALYIIFIMLSLFGFAYIISGPTPSQTPILTGPEVIVNGQQTNTSRAMLQLYNFNGVTITPPTTNLCTKGGANKNPDALIAYSPDQATAVSTEGQIALWVSDTAPPYISPNEVVIRSSGSIKTPGDRAAKAPDNYLLEPQLYVFPATVENNGKAYFPNFVKGYYNNGTALNSYNSDVLPVNSLPQKTFTAEFIWNVSGIGLTDNDYQIEFVAHDGHEVLGVKCITIRVYTPPAAESPGNELPL